MQRLKTTRFYRNATLKYDENTESVTLALRHLKSLFTKKCMFLLIYTIRHTIPFFFFAGTYET